MVPCDETEALADALENLVTDAELRSKLGEAGRQKVAAQFNVKLQAREYASLYRHLLENPQGANGSVPHRLTDRAKKAAIAEAVRRLSHHLSGFAVARDLLPLALRHDPVRTGPYLIGELLRRSVRRGVGAGR